MVEKIYDENQSDHFKSLLDEELVEIIRKGDTEALNYLLVKHHSFVRLKGQPYFLLGGDREDLIQEGMIGLYKAIRDYRADRLSSFKGFAELCITRQMITAIKTATRQKHIPLNSSVSLDSPVFTEDAERTLFDMLPCLRVDDPLEVLVREEQVVNMEKEMARVLSPLEKEVFALYLEEQSYVEIAQQLKRQAKSIDNALQRIKRKIETYWLTESIDE